MKHIKYLLCLLLPWLTACGSLPTPPVKVPFAPYQKGAKLETYFRIKDDASYVFALAYPVMYKDPFSQASFAKEDKLREIMAIPVQVQFKLFLIHPDKTEKLIVDEIKAVKGRGGGAILDKHLLRLRVDKGDYRVEVTSLDGEPDVSYLLSHPVYFWIAHPRGK